MPPAGFAAGMTDGSFSVLNVHFVAPVLASRAKTRPPPARVIVPAYTCPPWTAGAPVSGAPVTGITRHFSAPVAGSSAKTLSRVTPYRAPLVRFRPLGPITAWSYVRVHFVSPV